MIVEGSLISRFKKISFGFVSGFHLYTTFFSDIDECSSKDLNTCNPDHLCIDTIGSYNCKCKTGYTGDGRTCRGKQFRC